MDIRSGRTGRVLRTITSTTAGENLGFDAVAAAAVAGGETQSGGRASAGTWRRAVLVGIGMARIGILVALLLVGCGTAESTAPPVAEQPAGTLVVLSADNRLTAIDVASGRRVTRLVRSLPACGAELVVTGGHIVFSAVIRGATTVFSIPLSLDRRPMRLGTAHQFVRSARAGRVWLAGTDCDRTAMVGVREVSVEGEVTFESARRMPGNSVTAAVPEGLVVSDDRELFVWEPGTGRTRARLPLEMVFGAHGSRLAGCATGSDCKDLAVVDAATGRTVARPGGRLDVGATFSPDGSWLAVPARAGRRWTVALVDARTGAATLVRGLRARQWYPDLRWSSSGWLFIRTGFRVLAYRPGAARVERLPIRLPRSTIAVAAG